MAQLYYRYSTMNAGKSTELIKVAHNYEERGKNVLCLIPEIACDDGKPVTSSRIGISREAHIVSQRDNILTMFADLNAMKKIDCALVDECQFLTKQNVEQLAEIVDSFDVPVICYGLKNDFRNQLFEGAYHLLVFADKIEEIKTICWCGRKATMVARISEGKIVRTGDQIGLDKGEYISLCRKHYNDGTIYEPKN